MRMHRIEVDEEVYRYLKLRAEPFADTPNSVLRRELLRDSRRISETEAGGTEGDALPQVAPGTPRALEQILQVVHLVRKQNRTRSDATHAVADVSNIAPQTVTDKYCRQLNLTAYQFDRLLEQPDLAELRARLREKFGRHLDLVESIAS